MFSPRRLCASSFLLLCLLSTVRAQAELPNPGQRVGQSIRQEVGPKASQTSTNVTASATAERVRFTAPSNVVRMQLQVISESGQILFEVNSKGNVLDWSLQDSGGQRLQGTYLTVVTVKSLAGRLSERVGSVSIGEKQVELKAAAESGLTLALQQVVGPIEENATLNILKGDEGQAITVLANNGTDGQIIRDRGALSFRLGDFFSGKDQEQMRLTEEGRLGIGTSDPQAKLDVAGTIRAERVLIAKPAKQGSADKTTVGDHAQAPDGEQPLATGSGTVNRVAKWTETGGAGTLGDTQITESNGNVVVGNPSLTGNIQIYGTALQDVFSGMGPDVNVGPAFNYGYAGGTFGRSAGFFNVRPDALATPPNPSLRFMTANVERMIVTNTGNVGIGTTNPQAKLDVVGATKVSSHLTVDTFTLVVDASNDRVGVGTDIPTAQLHVVGATPSSGSPDAPDVLRVVGGTGRHYSTVSGSPGRGANVFVIGGDGGSATHPDAVNGAAAGGSITLQPGLGGTAPTNLAPPGNLLLAPTAGKVGIGTNNPLQQLHVVGTEILSTGDQSGFKFRNRGSHSSLDDWVWYSNLNIARLFRSGAGDLLYVNQNGNVGIGVSPGAKLQVEGGDAAITTQGNGVILKATDGASCFRVTVNNAGVLTTASVTCP